MGTGVCAAAILKEKKRSKEYRILCEITKRQQRHKCNNVEILANLIALFIHFPGTVL
jgi:hypothetical protein